MACKYRQPTRVADRISGYPKTIDPKPYPGHAKRVELRDWDGNKIADGRIISCTRVRPHERGAWISGERCSYQFQIKRGNEYIWYAGRGRGDGIAMTARRMKTKPRR